jgi:hypothetical protein
MRGDNNAKFTDARADEIFARNHGAEEREYYAPRPPASGSMWDAMIDAKVGRGACRRTPAVRYE